MLGTVISIVALSLAGCGGTQAPASTPPPQATSTAVETGFAFAKACDTSGLSSYRAQYKYTWESLKSGQKEKGTWEVVQAEVREPPAHHISLTAPGVSLTGGIELVQFGNVGYVIHFGSDMATPDNTAALTGNRFVSDMYALVAANRGELVKKGETVAGVLSDHYAFDEKTLGANLGLGDVTAAKGDVWVSTEFGVVVKYVAHYEGKNLAVGGGEQGTVDVTMDLTRINRPVFVPSDMVVLDDAADFTSVSSMISYTTAKSETEIINFYETRMQAEKNWTINPMGREGHEWSMVNPDDTSNYLISRLWLQAEAGRTRVTVIRWVWNRE